MWGQTYAPQRVQQPRLRFRDVLATVPHNRHHLNLSCKFRLTEHAELDDLRLLAERYDRLADYLEVPLRRLPNMALDDGRRRAG